MSELQIIIKKLSGIEGDIKEMIADIAVLKSENTNKNSEIESIESILEDMKSDIRDLKSGQALDQGTKGIDEIRASNRNSAGIYCCTQHS